MEHAQHDEHDREEHEARDEPRRALSARPAGVVLVHRQGSDRFRGVGACRHVCPGEETEEETEEGQYGRGGERKIQYSLLLNSLVLLYCTTLVLGSRARKLPKLKVSIHETS